MTDTATRFPSRATIAAQQSCSIGSSKTLAWRDGINETIR
jgi:hypothetical protein